jgi:TolA-binding protein
MTRTLYIIAIVLFTTLNPFFSPADEQAKKSTVTESSQQKERYEKNMEERLGKLGRQLDDLKAKAAKMTKEAQKDIKQQLAEAEKKQKAVSRKLDALRRKSEKEWKNFSTHVDQAWDEFEKAYEKAKAHFKE